MLCGEKHDCIESIIIVVVITKVIFEFMVYCFLFGDKHANRMPKARSKIRRKIKIGKPFHFFSERIFLFVEYAELILISMKDIVIKNYPERLNSI